MFHEEIKKKITAHGHNNKYITTQEFDKWTSENFVVRLKEADLATKGDIDDFVEKKSFDVTLKDSNKKSYLKKKKKNHIVAENKLNDIKDEVAQIPEKWYSFLVRRNMFYRWQWSSEFSSFCPNTYFTNIG